MSNVCGGGRGEVVVAAVTLWLGSGEVAIGILYVDLEMLHDGRGQS